MIKESVTIDSKDTDHTLQENDAFGSVEHVVRLGRSRLDAGSIIDRGHEFSFPNGFNLEEFIVIANPISTSFGGKKLHRTTSDGRSAGAFVGPITDNKGRHYTEIMIKGIGVNTVTSKNFLIQQVDKLREVTSEKKTLGRILPIRYFIGKSQEISNHGFSLGQNVASMDSSQSQILSDAGLRTRKLIFLAGLSDEVPISTPTGFISSSDAMKALNSRPTIEIWAIRCRYRVRDVMFFDKTVDRRIIEIFAGSIFSTDNADNNPDKLPLHQNLNDLIRVDSAKKTNAAIHFAQLAKQIISRAELDENQRFSGLAHKFKNQDLHDKEVQQQFWSEYLSCFSTILGEQVGIMYSQGAFTDSQMLNNQNVTLLAEIVDHDVTYFDPAVKKDGSKIVEQFTQTITTLSRLVSMLYVFDLIHKQTDIKTIIDSYIDGLLSALTRADRQQLHTALTEYYSTYKPHITSLPLYQQEVSFITQTDQLFEKIKKNPSNLEKEEERLKHKFIWTPYTTVSKGKWALRGDYLGMGGLGYVFETLAAAGTN